MVENAYFAIPVRFNDQGLIPAIIQDADNGTVLMMGYMSANTLAMTIEKGETYFWSRSRKEVWHKGEQSGNIQKVVEITLDCDGDTLLIKVHPQGPACHTGQMSCFHHSLHKKTG